MREIKFRAWHKKIKEMFYDVQNSFHSLGDKDDNKTGYFPDYHGFNEVLKDKNLILMQYTGLKDENKKDVYEGDIVQTDDYGLRQGIVKGGYSGGGVFNGFYISSDYLFTPEEQDLEVIGNVYENPELLTKR